MIVEIYLSKPVEPVGDCARFYIETNDQEFIHELKKYVCPFRLSRFLDEAMEQFDDIKELIRLEPGQKIDLFINLAHISEKIIKDPNLFAFSDKYLEQTKHLDKYGNELPLEEIDVIQEANKLIKQKEEFWSNVNSQKVITKYNLFYGIEYQMKDNYLVFAKNKIFEKNEKISKEQLQTLSNDLKNKYDVICDDLEDFNNWYFFKDYVLAPIEKEFIEESDLTQKSDRGYEMQLDNLLYKK